MSKLLKFTNYIKDREFVIDDLARFTEIIEPIKHTDGKLGYQLKQFLSTSKVIQRCKVLINYTWHCRDYVRKILSENGIPNQKTGEIINKYIHESRDIQVISFLANEYKHAGTNNSQKWAVNLEPRYSKPYVYGVMQSFPHRLKPTFYLQGDSIPEFEFTGSAGYGNLKFQFNDFDWIVSCIIEDKNGSSLGDVTVICENAFQIWLQVLRDYNIPIEH